MRALLREWKTYGPREALLGGTSLRNAGRLEGFFLRLLFAFVIWRSLEFFPAYTSAPKPVGIAAWPALWDWLGWEITRLADPEFWGHCLTWVKVALVFYVLGVGLPVALPVLAVIHVAIRTLNNSQGAAHHGFQMVTLVLIAQTLVVWILALTRGWFLVRKADPPRWAAPGNWTWIWMYSIAIAAATYVISVCSKLDESKGQWLQNSPYVATQIVKTYRQNYYNNLDPQYIQGVMPASPDEADPATDRYRHPIPPSADWLGRHPDFARILFGSGFFLELLAFLAVLDRRAGLLIGFGLISMHSSITWLMELNFPFNERTVGVFFLNAAGWLILMCHDRQWRPGRRIWLVCGVLAGLLAAGHAATLGSDSPWAHMLEILMQPAAVVPELFRWPQSLYWAVVTGIQTLLLAALVLTIRSFLPARFRN